ncbi:cupin-like domain-containing protein [Hyalangium sp.]|uniref:cupin-like domain-containing protein n=1 Tax=Hyalangium sp. TaxID=2028555 RepID=UPI002D57DA06|nr:cupin-like domain-containing protein [Hyalangium sp.]HYH97993.1 cupin-like domain-containing protein [Hyalangium sp.]
MNRWTPVERMSRLSSGALAARTSPLVLTEAIGDWPALRNWTPAFFRGLCGEREVWLHRYTRRNALKATLGAYVDGLEGRGPLADSGPELYFAYDASVLGGTTRLRDDFDFRPLFPAGMGMPKTGLWMGRQGAHTPLHYDMDALNLHAVLRGRKRFILFPPEDSPHLYPSDVFEWTTVFSEVNLARPDLARHPLAVRARGLEAVVGPGEVLLLPRGWWHDVVSLEDSLSLNAWWVTPDLFVGARLWHENIRALLHRAGLHARNRCTCCGHGDLRRHLGWGIEAGT